jgi:hypothetical protein
VPGVISRGAGSAIFFFRGVGGFIMAASDFFGCHETKAYKGSAFLPQNARDARENSNGVNRFASI